MKLKDLYSYFEKHNISINSRLLSIILLPFFVKLYIENFVWLIYCIVGILGIFLIDLFIKKKYHSIFLTLVIYLIYSVIIFEDTLFIIHTLRFRWFSLIFISVVYLIIYKSKNSFKLINVFIIFFTITEVIFSGVNKNDVIIDRFNNENSSIFFNNLTDKKSPVILIILDELSSSEEIYNYTRDSLDYNFDKELKKIEFNSFPVFETLSFETIFSMPSIFNFNLHRSKEFLNFESTIEFGFEGSKKRKKMVKILKKNMLIDSLKSKDVLTHSYGLISFLDIPKKPSNYLWEENTISNSSTLLNKIFTNTLYGWIIKKIKVESRYWNNRKEVLNSLNSLNPVDNNFYYFHFYAPHAPFSQFNEFQNDNTLSKLENHIRFKRFFLPKILNILKQEKFSKSRIIISGDHGFRGDAKINKYKTSLYLKGYDNISDVKHFVVQDLAYLINQSF